jgi:hypothetical protein
MSLMVNKKKPTAEPGKLYEVLPHHQSRRFMGGDLPDLASRVCIIVEMAPLSSRASSAGNLSYQGAEIDNDVSRRAFWKGAPGAP